MLFVSIKIGLLRDIFFRRVLLLSIFSYDLNCVIDLDFVGFICLLVI